tara:strand:- start:3067 stop:4722 length:1656 start_codon:yes stop_codon:yes gene_type:complete
MNHNAIIVFLALMLLGLYLSKNSASTIMSTSNLPINVDQQTLTNAQNAQNAQNALNTQNAQNNQIDYANTPEHNNMNPYFGSNVTQPIERSVNLSNYTGGSDINTVKKQEVENCNIGKDTILSKGQVDTELTREYYNTSVFMQSERPFEQIQVGKGLGVNPDVPSSGGFHQDSRIIPPQWSCTNTNRDTFKQMQLTPNTSNTVDRTLYENDLSNNNRQFMTREVLPTKSTINSHTLHNNDQNLINRGFVQESSRAGIVSIGSNGAEWSTPISVVQEHNKTQNRESYEKCDIMGNPAAQNTGNVVLTDNIQYANNRDSTNVDCVQGNNLYGAPMSGPPVLPQTSSKHMALGPLEQTNISSTVYAHNKQEYIKPSVTNRNVGQDTLNVSLDSSVKVAPNLISEHAQKCPPITQRDKTNHHIDSGDFKNPTGHAASNDKAHTIEYNDILNDLDMQTKREVTAENLQPGPQNINNRSENVNEVIGFDTKGDYLKSDQLLQSDRISVENTMKAPPIKPHVDKININKLEVMNDRIVSDATSNKTVLSTNELHNSIV